MTFGALLNTNVLYGALLSISSWNSLIGGSSGVFEHPPRNELSDEHRGVRRSAVRGARQHRSIGDAQPGDSKDVPSAVNH